MATDTNSITISGNITRDPEMRYTPSGVSKVSFGVAVNRSWRNQQSRTSRLQRRVSRAGWVGRVVGDGPSEAWVAMTLNGSAQPARRAVA